MLYKTASIITGLFYNFIFITMKGPNKLLKLKLKLNKQFNYGPFQLKTMRVNSKLILYQN